jgi:peptidoglycan/xylan/chitin deacetylase (PgdA/CDA1 family)
VALSFDDGPDPRWTPSVLATLARYHAHATFFLVGSRVDAFPGFVRAELVAGDEIADHTWSHPLLTRLSRGAVQEQIERGAAALERAGAPVPTLFRPPYGKTDPTIDDAVRADHLRLVLWNVAVEHYVDHATEQAALHTLLRLIGPGAVILAHDGGGDRSRTIALLPLLLDQLAHRGYRFATVSTLLASGRPETTRS